MREPLDMEVDRELWEVTARGQTDCLLVPCAALWRDMESWAVS